MAGTRATAALMALMALAGWVPVAGAQEPARSFDALHTRLKPGDIVWVTDAQGNEIKGTLREITPASIAIDGREPRVFTPDRVQRVQARAGSRVGWSALWGGIAGAATGVALAAAYPENDLPQPCSCTVCGVPSGTCGTSSATTVVHWSAVPLLAGVGAGLGALVGAVLPDRRREVYRAPAAGASAQLSLAPILTRHTRGVLVAYSF